MSEDLLGSAMAPVSGSALFLVNATTFELSTGDTVNINGIGGEGVLGDVVVGYDHAAYGNVIIGTQFEASYSGLKSTATSSDNTGTASTEYGPEFMFSILARVGHVVNPSTLVYGLIGWTNARFEFDFQSTDPTDTPAGLTSTTQNGISLGAGIETFISENTTIRAEYRFTDFSTANFTDPANGDTISYDPSMHVGRIAIVFRN